MLIPALQWLVENKRLDASRHDAIVDDLAELAAVEVSTSEARQLLWKLVKKMLNNFQQAISNSVRWTSKQLKKLFS